MKKYEQILEGLLRSIEKRDGRKPTELRALHGERTDEGMRREGICQLLAHEPLRRRLGMFCLYPELIIPYLCRIRRVKKV